MTYSKTENLTTADFMSANPCGCRRPLQADSGAPKPGFCTGNPVLCSNMVSMVSDMVMFMAGGKQRAGCMRPVNCLCGFSESEVSQFQEYFNEGASAEEFAVGNKIAGACQYSMHACQYNVSMKRAASV